MAETAALSAPSRKSAMDPMVSLGLAIVLIFFLISGGIAYFNIQTLRNDNQWIVHSHQVITTLDDLLSTMKDAETGQRGYLLTYKDRYLEPYNSALAAVGSQLDELAQETRDNPSQQARIGPLRQHVAAKLAELKETIDLRRNQGFDAALSVVVTDRGKVEMDIVRTQIATMDQEEADLRNKRLAEMADAYSRALVSGILSCLLGIVLTLIVGFLIRRAAITRQRQEWLQSGQVGLASAILGDQRTEQLGDNILQFLARYLDAQAGAVFVSEGAAYQRVSTYGVPADAKIPERFAAKDGLLGQAVIEGRPFIIRDVPDGYLTVASALGQDKPRHLVISPASADGAVNTVVELGFISPVSEDILTFLDQASEAIGVAVRSANYRAELQNLVEETQRQSEELQVQSEELRVSNEELEEQSRALKESQARLEQQ